MNGSATLWYNGQIYTPDHVIPDGKLLVLPNGVIGGVGRAEWQPDHPGGMNEIDLKGRNIVPGLIDVHVHGGNGVDIMSEDEGALELMALFHAKNGTTSWCPTTLTASVEDTVRAVKNAAAAKKRGTAGAEINGIHLEGPFLNPIRGGAQNPDFLRYASIDEIDRYLQAAEGLVKLVTIAPELPGGMEAVRYFTGRGVTVSIGHSDADYEELKEAVAMGVGHSTHHFNGMRPMHHRDPGTAGGVLLIPHVTTELIADGIHVHPDIIRLLFQIKSPQYVCLITDAVLCAGCPDGEYEMEGQTVVMANGSIHLKKGSSLAGSTLTMIQAVRNAMDFTGLPLETVLPSATVVPARQIGVDQFKGSLETGKHADFLILDTGLNIVSTYVRGKRVV